MNFKSIQMIVATMALCTVAFSPAVAASPAQHRVRVNQRTWEIRTLVDAAERTSNAFRDAVERRDRNTNTPGRYGTTYRERFFNELAPSVRRLDESFERLRRVADNHRPRAGRDEMMQVLRNARVVNRFFSRNMYTWGRGVQYRRSADLDMRWQNLRRDINALARAYGLSQV